MGWLIAAFVVSTILGSAAGATEKKAKEKEVAAIKEAAAEEKASIEKARQLLNKTKDEAISRTEIDYLAAEGMIGENETLMLQSLADSEMGITGTLTEFAKQANTIYADTEELAVNELVESNLFNQETLKAGLADALKSINLSSTNAQNMLNQEIENIQTTGEISREQITQASLESIEKLSESSTEAKQTLEAYKEELVNNGILSREAINTSSNEAIAQVVSNNAEAIKSLELAKQTLIDSGVASRDEIDKGIKEGIKTISGATDEAVQALTPFQLAGTQALERVQYMSGLLSPEEANKHLETYGEIKESPLFQYKMEQRMSELDKRQKALGRTFSGEGATEFRNEIDRLIAEDMQQQIDTAQGLINVGSTAATNIAGLREREGQQISGLQERGALSKAESLQTQGTNVAGLDQGIAGIQERQGGQIAGLESQRGGLLANQYMQEAGISAGVASQISQIEQQAGMSIADIINTRGRDFAASLLQQAGIQGNLVNNIANIELQTGQTVAGLTQQTARDVVSGNMATSGQIAGLRQGFGAMRGQTQQQLGRDVSNVQMSVAEARRAIRTNSTLNRANLRTGASNAISNIMLGNSAQNVNLIANQARQSFLTDVGVAGLNTEALTAPYRGLMQGLNLFNSMRSFGGNQNTGGATK